MHEIYLSLGSNIGNREENLQKAKNFLKKEGISILQESNIYETEPLGVDGQERYLNQVIHIETSMTPELLLNITQESEKKAGRETSAKKWDARIIDIDILLYGNHIIHKPHLTIPHEEMHKRNFVLSPLNEIASDAIHPILQKTIRELKKTCKDTLEVKKV